LTDSEVTFVAANEREVRHRYVVGLRLFRVLFHSWKIIIDLLMRVLLARQFLHLDEVNALVLELNGWLVWTVVI